jgi:hypothetical protein
MKPNNQRPGGLPSKSPLNQEGGAPKKSCLSEIQRLQRVSALSTNSIPNKNLLNYFSYKILMKQ